MDTLAERIEPLLQGSAPEYDAALRTIAASFGAVTATLHRADSEQRLLHMVAHLGLPEALVPITARIPFGKGIAGLCAERAEPITICNLQTDDSGSARPSAAQTGVAGAIAVPVLSPSGALVGTLGVGKPSAHDYTPEEQRMLGECARLLGRALSGVGQPRG